MFHVKHLGVFKEKKMKEFINNEFLKYDIHLNKEQIEKFDLYLNYLLEENEKINLTAITDKKEIVIKHFIDSVLPYKLFKEKSTIVDIGAGAGFPSVPLMIIRPDLKFLILDSVNKKVEFIKRVCEKLNLRNCEILHSRCEDLAKNPKYREKYDYCIARGVANLSSLLEYCAGFVKMGGQIIAYKSRNYQNEIEGSKNTIKILNLKLNDTKQYVLDGSVFENSLEKSENELNDSVMERYMLIFDKCDKLLDKYPRLQNKVRTNPLN